MCCNIPSLYGPVHCVWYHNTVSFPPHLYALLEIRLEIFHLYIHTCASEEQHSLLEGVLILQNFI